MSSIRSIRKRAQAGTKRRNAFRWGFRAALRRAIEGVRLPDLANVALDLGTFMDAHGLNSQALPSPELHDPQTFVPKVQLWAGRRRPID